MIKKTFLTTRVDPAIKTTIKEQLNSDPVYRNNQTTFVEWALLREIRESRKRVRRDAN